MSAVQENKTAISSVSIRPMEDRDVVQSAEIERDAFPTHFPSTSFRRELKKRRVSYLVAYLKDREREAEAIARDLPDQYRNGDGRPLFGRLLGNARGLWSRPSAWEPGQDYLVGFLGVWHMVDEAHVVSVGVREGYRGRGIGELLLISAIEQAMERRSRAVSLEVRVSNDVARNLYSKYGFAERGLRKGYYTDNREDAVIMTTDSIQLPPYPQRFRSLVWAHEQRWGRSERILS